MASCNRVILVGNLTRDPELRFTPSNTPVSDIGLAVNDRRKNASGEWVEETVNVYEDFKRIHQHEPAAKAWGISILSGPGVEIDFGSIVAKTR